MLQVKQAQYIYPPRPNTAIPREMSIKLHTDPTGMWDDWRAQLKYNDSRCVIKLRSDGAIEMWNRHNERMSYNIPIPLEEQLYELHSKLGPGYHMLDGGLIHQKHPHIKDTIVLWDILVDNSQHQIGTTYQERYSKLRSVATGGAYLYGPHHLGQKITQDIFTPNMWPLQEAETAWDLVDAVNASGSIILEGLMLKNPTATLGFGFTEKNNEDWMVRSRISTGRHSF